MNGLEKPVYVKSIYRGAMVRIVDGKRIYEVTDMWIDDKNTTWLRLDHHYVYASHDVRSVSA